MNRPNRDSLGELIDFAERVDSFAQRIEERRRQAATQGVTLGEPKSPYEQAREMLRGVRELGKKGRRRRR